MVKHRLALLVLPIMIIAILVGCGKIPANTATTFNDTLGNWASAQIGYLKNQGVIAGYEDGTFRPDGSISRAEFITIVNKGFNFDATADIHYTDVNSTDWFYNELAKAKAAGYIAGYPDGSMRPNDYITREQGIAILARVLQLNTSQSGPLPFTDAASFSNWSKKAIAAMFTEGYLRIYPDGSLKPQEAVSRAEIAYMVACAMNKDMLLPVEVNVRNYGAQGDGITDDTHSIYRAIASAATKVGGTVIIPSGQYVVLDLPLQAKVNIIGDDATLIKYGWEKSSAAIELKGSETATKGLLEKNTPVGVKTIKLVSTDGFTAGDYVVIRDSVYEYISDSGSHDSRNQEFRQIASITGNEVTLTEATIGSYATSAAAEMVKIKPVDNMMIDGLNIVLPPGIRGAGIIGDLAYNVKVQNCTVTGGYSNGIKFYRSAYIDVDHNTVRDGQNIERDDGDGYGIVFGESCHNCIMQNNYTYNIRENAVSDNCRYSSIINNTDEYCYIAGWDTHGRGSEHIIIKGNVSKNSRRYGIYVAGAPVPDSYVTVQGNKIYNPANNGIATGWTHHVDILENEIVNPSTAGLGHNGILVQYANNINVKNNNITSDMVTGTRYGIYINSSKDTNITGNTLSKLNKGYGIVFESDCVALTIEGNNLSEISKYNFWCKGTGNTKISIINNVTDDTDNLLAGTEYLSGNSWQ